MWALEDIKKDLEGLTTYSISEVQMHYVNNRSHPVTVIYLYCLYYNEHRQYYLQYEYDDKEWVGNNFMGVIHRTDPNGKASTIPVYYGVSQAPELVTILEDKLGVIFA